MTVSSPNCHLTVRSGRASFFAAAALEKVDHSLAPHAGHVLVIDDEPKLVNMVSRALSRLNVQVDRAYDGPTGLTMALSGRYEVVLLDLALPGLSGVSVLRRVIEARPEQQVVVCSGRRDPEQKAQCLKLGASGYMTKPFDLSRLVARVRTLRADHQSTPERSN
jgi:DNA-binding response OmpR family regulator